MAGHGPSLKLLPKAVPDMRKREVSSVGRKAQRVGKKALHRVQCVLRDAPLLRRVAPQHKDMLLIALRKTPHPEVPREARSRRTHDILQASLAAHSAGIELGVLPLCRTIAAIEFGVERSSLQ